MRYKTDKEILTRAKELFPEVSELEIRRQMYIHSQKHGKPEDKKCCGACGGSGRGHSTSVS